jgi:hypothetical protein
VVWRSGVGSRVVWRSGVVATLEGIGLRALIGVSFDVGDGRK